MNLIEVIIIGFGTTLLIHKGYKKIKRKLKEDDNNEI